MCEPDSSERRVNEQSYLDAAASIICTYVRIPAKPCIFTLVSGSCGDGKCGRSGEKSVNNALKSISRKIIERIERCMNLFKVYQSSDYCCIFVN